jgi:hypothetical protein
MRKKAVSPAHRRAVAQELVKNRDKHEFER